MKLRHLYALAALLFSLLNPLSAAFAAPFTFTFNTTPPGGAISGLPGELVGWGYQLVNTDTSNWFVPTQLNATSFTVGTPDASYFDFPILAPGASATAVFDPAAGTGLYGLLLSSFALPTQSDNGSFALSGEWWSGDPLAGGSFIQAGSAVLAAFSVEVAALAAVPLPGSQFLLGAGLLALWLAQSLNQWLTQSGRQKGAQLGVRLR